MKLPIPRDMEPMLSAPQDAIPQGGDWEYEPKWDGFRTLVFRDGDEVELVSFLRKGGRPPLRGTPPPGRDWVTARSPGSWLGVAEPTPPRSDSYIPCEK